MSKKFIIVLIALIIILLLLAIQGKQQPTTPADFVFGDEYAHPDIANYYSRLGTTGTKIADVDWSLIEPQAPVNGEHKYDWTLLDSFIQPYQAAGYQIFHLVIKPNADWATHSKENQFANPSFPLKDGLEDDYQAWLKAMVERYPIITHWEIMSEAQHDGYFQPGDLDRIKEYEKILKLSYSAIKQANPQAKVILSGITLGPRFDEGKEEVIPGGDEASRFIEASLKMTDYYDEVEFHYLRDWLSAYGIVNYLRNKLKISKPIWAGDVFPLANMIPHPMKKKEPYYPQGDKLFSAVDRAMVKKLWPNARTLPNDEKILNWYRKEQAQSIVKKTVVAADLGLKGIMMGNSIDWIAWRTVPTWIRDVAWMGLVDVKIISPSKIKVIAPRPAFTAYQELIKNIKGFISVEKLPSEKGVFLYQFNMPDDSVLYAAWYDDGIWECPIYCQVEKEGGLEIRLPDGHILSLTETPVVIKSKK